MNIYLGKKARFMWSIIRDHKHLNKEEGSGDLFHEVTLLYRPTEDDEQGLLVARYTEIPSGSLADDGPDTQLEVLKEIGDILDRRYELRREDDRLFSMLIDAIHGEFEDQESKREEANLAGMSYGVNAYNEARGFGEGDHE